MYKGIFFVISCNMGLNLVYIVLKLISWLFIAKCLHCKARERGRQGKSRSGWQLNPREGRIFTSFERCCEVHAKKDNYYSICMRCMRIKSIFIFICMRCSLGLWKGDESSLQVVEFWIKVEALSKYWTTLESQIKMALEITCNKRKWSHLVNL